MVRDSAVGGDNVQVGGDVAGSVIAGGLTVQSVVVNVLGDGRHAATAHHDRYAATRRALESFHTEVLDREDELCSLLDALCGTGTYHVVEAPAFAGKTAFMVELCRRLNALGCPTAVFYIVDRYSNRSGDFLEAVIGQLIGVLRVDEEVAAAEKRSAQFARLWDAVAALGTAERPAVLLVDGLDEQLPIDAISPLLPVHVSGYAHVVVATRSLPDPRTATPPHHPLGASRFSLVHLIPSRHAKAQTENAKRHLEAFLASADPVREEIAALILVASAPLSRLDLADLLGLAVCQVAQHLYDVERCLLPIAIAPSGVGYQWAHAKYGEFVHDWIGAGGRARVGERIVKWATRHAAAGWPDTTPSFLLHGLHHFVRAHAATADKGLLTALVSHERRQRLLATFGHDGVFLDTIAVVRALTEKSGGQSTDDLELLFRLDLHHLLAVSYSPFLPEGMLRLLVLSGQADQAEGVAFATEERFRAVALAEVAEALADTGLLERARGLVDASWTCASMVDEHLQPVVLRSCVRAARKAGAKIPRLELDDYVRSRHAVSAEAGVLGEPGEHAAARVGLDALAERQRQHPDLGPREWADIDRIRRLLDGPDAGGSTGRLIDADGPAHDGDSALREADELLRELADNEDLLEDVSARLIRLGNTLLATGRVQDAAHVAQQMLTASRRYGHPFIDYNMHDLALALIEAGDLPGAREVVEANPNRAWRRIGAREVELAEATTGLAVPDCEDWPLSDQARLAVAMAAVNGTRNQALRLATDLIEGCAPADRWLGWDYALDAVEAFHRANDIGRGEAVLMQVKPLTRRAEALARLSFACRASDSPEADRLLNEAIEAAFRVRKGGDRLSTLHGVLRAAGPLPAAVRGMPRLVATFRRAVDDLGGAASVELSASTAVILWHARQDDHARAFALRALQATDDTTGPETRRVLCEALACAGEYDIALDLADGLHEFGYATIADVSATNGDLTIAVRAAEKAFEIADAITLSDDGLTGYLMDTMLRSGRPDLARHLYEKFDGDNGERLACTLFRAMTPSTHEADSLTSSRNVQLHTWRAAALVGWASAAHWPPDVRRRNLRQLKESATSPSHLHGHAELAARH